MTRRCLFLVFILHRTNPLFHLPNNLFRMHHLSCTSLIKCLFVCWYVTRPSSRGRYSGYVWPSFIARLCVERLLTLLVWCTEQLFVKLLYFDVVYNVTPRVSRDLQVLIYCLLLVACRQSSIPNTWVFLSWCWQSSKS